MRSAFCVFYFIIYYHFGYDVFVVVVVIIEFIRACHWQASENDKIDFFGKLPCETTKKSRRKIAVRHRLMPDKIFFFFGVSIFHYVDTSTLQIKYLCMYLIDWYVQSMYTILGDHHFCGWQRSVSCKHTPWPLLHLLYLLNLMQIASDQVNLFRYDKIHRRVMMSYRIW